MPGQRISEYGKPHAVRFRKNVDREIAMICLEHDLRPSTLIQKAVECFIHHPECPARRNILQGQV
jgi:hypothetical protein